MVVKLFIGGLNYSTGAEVLGKEFEKIGNVVSASIATTNDVSRGFGFVEMSNDAEAQKAIASLNGS